MSSSLRALRAVLGTLAPDASWRQHTQAALRLRALLEANLPASLASACEAWLEPDGVLVIACPNGAVAAKMKQLLPRLLQNLQRAEGQIRSIRAEVQAKRGGPQSAARRAAKVPPPASAAADLESTAAAIRAPELAAAMRRLAAKLRDRGP